jgi:hypothetical protein
VAQQERFDSLARGLATNQLSRGQVLKSLISRRDFLKRASAIGLLGLAGGISLQPRQASAHMDIPAGLNPLEHREYDNLKVFTSWLAREGVKGYIGEINWPNNRQRSFNDEAQWNTLGEKWYQWADAANLWVTMWCVDEWQQWGGFWLTTYVSVGDGQTRPISQPLVQAPIYEGHPATAAYERGINVSGAERWEDGINSNSNRGTYDVLYWYASQQTMDYLASRGNRIIRLPFRWERIQPTLGGALNTFELTQLKSCIARAAQAGLRVILDLHNYAGYHLSVGKTTIEAESMTLEGNSKVSASSAASGGQEIALYANGAAGSAPYTGSISQIALTARQSACGTEPARASVYVDGSRVATLDIDSTSYATRSAAVSVGSGSHTIRVAFENDFTSGTTCDRNLYVDKLDITPQANASREYKLGSSRLPASYLYDVWRRLSNNFKSDSAVVAYDIMNEPVNMPAAGYASPQKAWESYSQGVVNTIRNNGDNKLIMVPGYHWSLARLWEYHHPRRWISDPANNHMYEAHHYFDEGSGRYDRSYDEAVAYWRSQGY